MYESSFNLVVSVVVQKTLIWATEILLDNYTFICSDFPYVSGRHLADQGRID